MKKKISKRIKDTDKNNSQDGQKDGEPRERNN